MTITKRMMAILLSIAMALSLSACGHEQNNKNYSSSSGSDTGAPKQSAAALTTEDLADIFAELNVAEEYANSISSILLQKWTTDSYFAYFFDEIEFRMSSKFSKKADYVNVHDYRGKANDALDKVKECLGTNGTGESYTSAKNYYLAVKEYLALVSEYPEGYSLLTYSSAISDCQDECRTCRTDLEFYVS